MIAAYPITVSQAEFRTAPESERLFYLKLGLILNEVSALNKLSLFSLRQSDDREIIDRAGHTLAMLSIRLLIGRLYEAYPVITKGYAPLKPVYEGLISDDGVAGYKNLNVYFSDKDNLIKLVRHKVAFHTDDEVFKAGVNKMDDDENLVDYMCQARGNSLFWSGEAALISVVKHLVGTNDTIDAYKKFLADARAVARHINDFSYAFGLAFFHRNFPDAAKLTHDEKIEIEGAPVLTEFSLPWFFEIKD